MTSPAKFKKDKEIIAEYDTQVKGFPSEIRSAVVRIEMEVLQENSMQQQERLLIIQEMALSLEPVLQHCDGALNCLRN